jgi:hypothetical protein
MIKVKCRTNIDKFRGKHWPKIMQVMPSVGDYVRADCGAELKICRITHGVARRDYVGYNQDVYNPMIYIDLTDERNGVAAGV